MLFVQKIKPTRQMISKHGHYEKDDVVFDVFFLLLKKTKERENHLSDLSIAHEHTILRPQAHTTQCVSSPENGAQRRDCFTN